MYWQDRQPLRQDDDRDIILDAQDTTLDFRGNFAIIATKLVNRATGKLAASATYNQGLEISLSGS